MSLMSEELFNVINRLNNKDQRFNPIERKMMKITEELGELAEAILIHQDHKLSKVVDNKEETRDHILEEACDVLIMINAILIAERFSKDDISGKIALKLNKWEKGLDSQVKLDNNK